MAKNQKCPCASSTAGSPIQITNNTSASGTFSVYSKRAGFNCDSTCIVTQGSKTVIYNIDGTVKQNPPVNSEVHWSQYDPNRLWAGQSPGKFGYWDVATQQYTAIYDAGAIFGASDCLVTMGDFEGSVMEDRCVLLRVTCPSQNVDRLVSLDVTNGNVLGTISTPATFNNGSFSRDCSCILIGIDSNDSFDYYDPTLSTLKGSAFLPSYPQETAHEDWVIASDGSQVTIVAWDQQNGWVKPDGTFGFLGNSLQNFGITNSGHVSGVASVNCPGLAFLSDSFPNQESYLVKIIPDGNGGYAFDPILNFGNIAGGLAQYEDITKGTISPLGDYIMYSQPVNGIPQSFIRKINNDACPPIDPVEDKINCSQSSWDGII